MAANWTEEEFSAYLARKDRKNHEPMLESSKQRKRLKTANAGQIRVCESDEQKALLNLCRLKAKKHPELALLYHVPNGSYRHKATAARLKAEGVKRGMPDLHLPVARWGYLSLYVEMKAAGGKISEEQHRTMRSLEKEGHKCVVAWGAEEAWRIIEAYLGAEEGR